MAGGVSCGGGRSGEGSGGGMATDDIEGVPLKKTGRPTVGATVD